MGIEEAVARSEPDIRPVIGLEVHAQLRTRTKMFCGCRAEFGGTPNSRVCPVCLGLPGALPVPNREAVRLAIRFATAIGADVQRRSVWSRKNYFYPDLPKGYQISQFDLPLATGGRVRIEPEGETPRFIGVTRVHMEEDAGKSVHDFGEAETGIDLNRCGQPLIEIVGEPEIRSPQEAYLYLERMKSILKATGVCDADMEKGSLRCDANISVHRQGEPWGTRAEIKNLNSFRHVRRALEYEIGRQTEVIRTGGLVVQESRLWDERLGRTRSMRSKEDAHDYRYFPEPDLPPLVLTEGLLREAAVDLPELPHVRRDRFVTEYELSVTDAHRLTLEPELADYFEQAAKDCGNPKAAANWILSELLRALNERGLPLAEAPVSPLQLAEIVTLIDDGTISGKIAKQVFEEVAESGTAPGDVVSAQGLRQISDAGAIEAVCGEIVAANPGQAAAFRAGKRGLLGFFVGQVMKKTAGQANPKLVNAALTRILDQDGV